MTRSGTERDIVGSLDSPDASTALLVVDVQNDFCPGGALPVPDGDAVVPVLDRYIDLFVARGLTVIASRDWHPPHTSHFTSGGGPWPPHCVQGTLGAAFHPTLRLPPDAIVVTKGDSANDDGYSAFDGRRADRPLADVLRARGVTRLWVGGLATDYCVRASVLDALRAGFDVVLLDDAVRGIDATPGDAARAVAEMRAAGARIARLPD